MAEFHADAGVRVHGTDARFEPAPDLGRHRYRLVTGSAALARKVRGLIGQHGITEVKAKKGKEAADDDSGTGAGDSG